MHKFFTLIPLAVASFLGLGCSNPTVPSSTPREPVILSPDLTPNPAARFAQLKSEYDTELKSMTKEVKDPKTGQVTGYMIEGGPMADKYLPRLLELGGTDDEPTSIAALTLSIKGWPTDHKSKDAFDLLMKRYAASPRLADFAKEHRRHSYNGQVERLVRLTTEGKDPTAVAISLFQLAQNFNPNTTRIQGETADQETARREKSLAYYRRVVTEFSEIEKGSLANSARRSITQLQQLRAGLPAPPIAGVDLNGKPMKLDEYLGKVVVIDFWGSWCVPCRRKLPMMKAVAESYGDKGVVFVGVMHEQKATDATQAVEQEKLPWRNWLDLRDESGESPIVKAWGVVGFPSVYVLDQVGTIRFTRVQEQDELERAIDVLLAEKTTLPAKK